MDEMLDKNDLEILIKALNWNPFCSVPECLIPCKHAAENNGRTDDGLCCAHWEFIYNELGYACEICNDVYWWGGKLMTRGEPNPSLDQVVNIIGEMITK